MSKKVYEGAIDRRTDWGGDESTGGLPVAGSVVQAHIKERLESLEDEMAQRPIVIVDESLDRESTNAVQNAAVAARLEQIESRTVGSMEAETSEDESTVVISLKDSRGSVIADCEIPMGSGSGGDTDATAIRVSATVDRASVLEGGSSTLRYTYDNVLTSGEDKGTSTGQAATLTVTVKRGETVTYNSVVQNFSCNPGSPATLDLTPYLLVGVNDIYVKAEYYDERLGKTRSKQAWTQVSVVAFSLESDYSLTTELATGGYSGTAAIPFRVRGAGLKRIYLYLDGVQSQYKDISASAPTTDVFGVDTSALTPGMHSVQMVGKVTLDGTEYVSESIYMTLMKRGASTMVGLSLVNPSGAIATTGHMTPEVSVKALEELRIKYGAYSQATQSQVEILVDGSVVQTLNVGRIEQTLSQRFTAETAPGSPHTITVRCGGVSQSVNVRVTAGAISIQEAAIDMVCKLDAKGRSNSEANPAQWADGGITTAFEGVDWTSSGWTGKTLKLLNGAKATIGYEPFATDPRSTGLTIEMTLKVSNIVDEKADIVSCAETLTLGAASVTKGFRIRGNEIAMLTGQTISYEDEDGNPQTRESKLAANYVEGRRMKVALVIRRDGGGTDKVMELYIDGNRAGADTYTASTLAQNNAKALVIDSAGADVEVERVRIYSRALSDDEELMNDIYDTEDVNEMVERYRENDVLSNDNEVDIDALLSRGKGVLKIVHVNTNPGEYGEGPMNDIYGTNDKSTDFAADVYYYSPLGRERNFVLEGCNIRIQGTSSTKYPSKNIRIYLAKGPNKSTPALTVGGVTSTNNKYCMRPNSAPVNLLTAKSDYSDSSMSLNTGGAKLYNDAMLHLGLLTPPQQWQRDQGLDVNVRQAIDGIPVDMFAAESAQAEPVYMGQYNLNNEKSDSNDVFGMTIYGHEEYQPTCPITLESLNNLNPLCLFQTGADADATLEANFDSAFEFNYPKDTYWTQAALTEAGKGTLATDAQRNAVKGLLTWIRSCVPSGMLAHPDYDDMSQWQSAKFVNEISQHFDVQHLLTYYLWTEFFVSVDQRAKNILWRTWDGQKWYATYYDGDTQRGKRNDSFMAYTPDTERDTHDAERNKKAFEGYESWLWCLVLGNLQTELATAAARLREYLTVNRVLGMLLVEQSGNWSDRVYNKSGELKYINPAIRQTYGKTWPFIFALQGADRSHSEWFIRERWKLMDAKYQIGEFTSDDLAVTLSRAASDAEDRIKVTGAKIYSYGYGTNNSPKQYTTGIVQPDVEVSMPVTMALNANDPLRIYGASRIKKIDMTGCYQRMQGSFDVAKASLLEEIDMSVPEGAGGYSQNWWIANIDKCGQLRRLNLKGQRHASTENGTRELNLAGLTRLEEVDARGTEVRAINFEPGAAVHTVYAPETLQSIRLESLHHLSSEGLHIGGYGSVQTVKVTGCPGVDTKAMVEDWLQEADSAISLELDGVNWTLADGSLLVAIAQKVNTVNMRGRVRITGAIRDSHIEVLKAKFGNDCFTPSAQLYIEANDIAIMTRETHPFTVNAILGASAQYITKAQAEAFTHVPGMQNNTDDNLDALRYFTNATSMGVCSNGQFRSVEVPKKIRLIPQDAFAHNAKLERVVLRENVEEFRNYVFSGCTRLKEIYCYATEAPQCDGLTFGYGDVGSAWDEEKNSTGAKVCKLYIPVGSAASYNDESKNWTRLASRYEFCETLITES